jgi:hypothetical protein
MKLMAMLKLLPRVTGAVEQLQVKGWYLSRTIWANLFALVGSIAYAVSGNDALTLSENEVAALAAAAVAGANIVLRILTRTPVGMRSVPGPAGRRSDGAEIHRDDIGV